MHGLSLMPRDDVPISEDGDASVHTEESGVQMDRAYYFCRLDHIGRELMASFCCWLCLCGGRLDCWCALIGSAL